MNKARTDVKTVLCAGCSTNMVVHMGSMRVETKVLVRPYRTTLYTRIETHASDVGYGYVPTTGEDGYEAEGQAVEIYIWLCPTCGHPGAASK